LQPTFKCEEDEEHEITLSPQAVTRILKLERRNRN
jgi:hypothetical protein